MEESRRRVVELKQHARHLAAELSASKLLVSRLEADNESLRVELRGALERNAKLEQQKNGLARKLANAQERVSELQQTANVVEAELKESQQRHAALEKKNTHLANELEKWQHSASERALILEKIQQETWIRLGRRLGIVKSHDVLPASSEMSLLPEGNAEAQSADPASDVAANWELLVNNGCEAHLIHPREDFQMVKVDIARVKTQTRWDIQLNLRGFPVTAGIRYALVFRGRAHRPRPIGAGFAKAHDPWSSLGLYETIRLTREWRTFREEFVALESDDNTRIHFDLGGNAAGVDLTSVSVQPINSFEGEPVSTPGNLRPENGQQV
jgi:hypothetical protein